MAPKLRGKEKNGPSSQADERQKSNVDLSRDSSLEEDASPEQRPRVLVTRPESSDSENSDHEPAFAFLSPAARSSISPGAYHTVSRNKNHRAQSKLSTMDSSDNESVLSDISESTLARLGASPSSRTPSAPAAAPTHTSTPALPSINFPAGVSASFEFEAGAPGPLQSGARASKPASSKVNDRKTREPRKTRTVAPQYNDHQDYEDEDEHANSLKSPGYRRPEFHYSEDDDDTNHIPQQPSQQERAKIQARVKAVPFQRRSNRSNPAAALLALATAASEAEPYPNQPEDDRKYLKPSKKDHWSNPGTPSYDPIRMLMADECVAPDHLLRRPDPSVNYLEGYGLQSAPQYDWGEQVAANDKKKYTGHPKYAAHGKNGTANRENMLYYDFTPKGHNIPLAGKAPEEPKEPDADLERGLSEIISEVRDKETGEYVEAFTVLVENGLTNIVQEEAFAARPSIRLPIPDHIKAILVDDWENVTKNQQLVPLPANHTVESILDDYMASENPKRQTASQAELLREVVQGLKEYFDKCLGRILLYRFERQQYFEVHEGWNAASGDLAGKTAVTTYGAEHFCRLLVSLPELIAQTNMDQQSCNRLCQEISTLTIWIGRNASSLFTREYETPGSSYIEKARNG